LRTDTARSPQTGREHDFHVLESLPWVNVIAINENREVIMVKQYRHGVKKVTLELPGGLVEPPDTPEGTARRELAEETGYTAENFTLLGKSHPQPAILDNYCYSYLAKGVKRLGSQRLDFTEDIEVRTVPLNHIKNLILNGEIEHAMVITAFFWYFTRLGCETRL
jgi:8-oxo-dGTP pyrophosphatase MutT (NUDIX family)